MTASPLRVVSYNIRYFSHALRGLAATRAARESIADRVAGLSPLADIICLQEVGTQLAGFMAELERAFAARAVPSPYVGLHFPAHVGRIRGLSIATSGLAIIVNRERLAVTSHNAASPWRLTEARFERLTDRRPIRVCAHACVADATGRRLHVFNAHLSLPTPLPQLLFWRLPRRLGNAPNQMREARTLASLVRRLAGEDPFVVVGDFNATPGSSVFRYLTEEAAFRSAHVELGDGRVDGEQGFSTFDVRGLVHLHIDHLFAGGGVSWVDLQGSAPTRDRRSPFAGLSDHVPLIGRFRLSSGS
jgi:endonuclease/exonuclease/phosphatase family metal-dependent hydrolase